MQRQDLTHFQFFSTWHRIWNNHLSWTKCAHEVPSSDLKWVVASLPDHQERKCLYPRVPKLGHVFLTDIARVQKDNARAHQANPPLISTTPHGEGAPRSRLTEHENCL